jgi:hypothetical protein
MFTYGDGDWRNGRQREAPSEVTADGVVALGAGGSERRIVVGGPGVRIAMDEVVEGSILVEAMDLAAVVVLEEAKEVAEEVVDLDDSLIGDRWQADLDGRCIGSHDRHLW